MESKILLKHIHVCFARAGQNTRGIIVFFVFSEDYSLFEVTPEGLNFSNVYKLEGAEHIMHKVCIETFTCYITLNIWGQIMSVSSTFMSRRSGLVIKIVCVIQHPTSIHLPSQIRMLKTTTISAHGSSLYRQV